mmetsp:Transcript_74331/g.170450  ORF Transcript_74331/g.170450 Transcript_74331/m.170450 type:complete len:105 (+) Transcript_74331:803-1117(+)
MPRSSWAELQGSSTAALVESFAAPFTLNGLGGALKITCGRWATDWCGAIGLKVAGAKTWEGNFTALLFKLPARGTGILCCTTVASPEDLPPNLRRGEAMSKRLI